jgi:hypothetical protein
VLTWLRSSIGFVGEVFEVMTQVDLGLANVSRFDLADLAISVNDTNKKPGASQLTLQLTLRLMLRPMLQPTSPTTQLMLPTSWGTLLQIRGKMQELNLRRCRLIVQKVVEGSDGD